MTAAPAPLTADNIVAANIFLGHMADRYRARVPSLTAEGGMQFALATFDAHAEDVTFGDPAYGWDLAHAAELVDSDLEHWD